MLIAEYWTNNPYITNWVSQKCVRNARSTNVRKNRITLLLNISLPFFFLFSLGIFNPTDHPEKLTHICKITWKYVILACNQTLEEPKQALLPLSYALFQSAAVPSLSSVCTLAGIYSWLHFSERKREGFWCKSNSKQWLFVLFRLWGFPNC